MRSKWTVAAIAGGVMALGLAARAQDAAEPAEAEGWKPELSAGADLASAYLFRGITYNDGMVVQPWASLTGLPLEFTVWANYDVEDYNGTLKKNEVSEIDYTVALPYTVGPVDVTLGYAFWTYPNSPVQDDQLVTLCLAHTFKEVFTFGVGGEYNTAGLYEETLYVKPYASYTHGLTDDLALELCGRVAYIDYNETEMGNGWMHYDLGTKLSWKDLAGGVTYAGRIDDDVLPTGPYGYDTHWLFMLSASHTF